MSRLVRRVHQPGVYFLTTLTWQRRQLFNKVELAEIVVQQLSECRDRGFYKLHQFVLMPDHLHVLLTPGSDSSLERAIQMIKGGSSRRIGADLQSRWPVWQPGFHDRFVRDESEYRNFEKYIKANPLNGRLVEKADQYPWSSASGKFPLDSSRFDHLQGLKPHQLGNFAVAAKAATHKS